LKWTPSPPAPEFDEAAQTFRSASWEPQNEQLIARRRSCRSFSNLTEGAVSYRTELISFLALVDAYREAYRKLPRFALSL
jgi:hypothetical protein